MCDITSYSVSLESRVNKCHELPLPALFKWKLAIIGPTHCMRLFGKLKISVVPYSSMEHREHPVWLCEGHLEVLEEYWDFSKIASGYHYKN